MGGSQITEGAWGFARGSAGVKEGMQGWHGLRKTCGEAAEAERVPRGFHRLGKMHGGV